MEAFAFAPFSRYGAKMSALKADKSSRLLQWHVSDVPDLARINNQSHCGNLKLIYEPSRAPGLRMKRGEFSRFDSCLCFPPPTTLKCGLRVFSSTGTYEAQKRCGANLQINRETSTSTSKFPAPSRVSLTFIFLTFLCAACVNSFKGWWWGEGKLQHHASTREKGNVFLSAPAW